MRLGACVTKLAYSIEIVNHLVFEKFTENQTFTSCWVWTVPLRSIEAQRGR